MSKVENCPNCGGTHFGSIDCPYLEKNMGEPCEVCGERTNYCCADCRIDGAGKVYVCFRDACRTAHEVKHKPTTPPPDRAPVTEGSGCVFCDLNIAKKQAGLGGGFYHEIFAANPGGSKATKFILCPLEAALAAREAQKGKGNE